MAQLEAVQAARYTGLEIELGGRVVMALVRQNPEMQGGLDQSQAQLNGQCLKPSVTELDDPAY